MNPQAEPEKKKLNPKLQWRFVDSSLWRRGTPTIKEGAAKLELPMLNGVQTFDRCGTSAYRKTALIFADFDSVIPGFDSFEDMETVLRLWFGTSVWIFRTPSMKLKVGILVGHEVRDWRTAVNILNECLPDRFTDTFDKSWTALSTCLLTVDALREWEAVDWALGCFEVDSSQARIVCSFNLLYSEVQPSDITWTMTDTPLPDLGYTADAMRVVRFIVSTRGVGRYGADLPQAFIAEVCGVSQATTSRTIKRLVQDGHLVVLSNRYKKGAKAKRYQLVGELAKLVRRTPRTLKNLPPLAAGQTFGAIVHWFAALKAQGYRTDELIEVILSNSEGGMSRKECESRVRSLERSYRAA